MARRIGNDEKSEHAEERRRELLKATLAVIARKGLSGLTINDVAVEAGCAYGIVNFYFKSKDRLLLAALDSLEKEFEAAWARSIANGGAPSDRLHAIVDLDFDRRLSGSKRIAIWAAFWAEAPRIPAYRACCGEMKRRHLARLVSVLTEVAAERDLGLPIETIARTLYAISDGSWIYAHVTGETRPEERERGRRLCNAYLAQFFPDQFSAADDAAEGGVEPPPRRRSPRTRSPSAA